MTRIDPCPLVVEWVENWAPDYIDDRDYNVTQQAVCVLPANHIGACCIVPPREIEGRNASAER